MAAEAHQQQQQQQQVPEMAYIFNEMMLWHHPGPIQSIEQFIEPTKHWENVETKRRVHSLLAATGMLDKPQVSTQVKARLATEQELSRVHDPAYVGRVKAKSMDPHSGLHNVGDETNLSTGGFMLAQLAAGAALEGLQAIMEGRVRTAYVMTRPPGHHAERDAGAGFCVFNNVAVAAAAALEIWNLERVAIVDYDVHHGNGTQHIFESDKRVLFISIHQDSNYPLHSGAACEQGVGEGEGFTINCPLPPGSGTGAHKAAFERCVLPALDAYQPQLVLVSSGFDASFLDPLSAQILGSLDFRWMMAQLKAAAERHCGGKLVAVHEGGYSEVYTPFCALAAIEALSGASSGVTDPFLHEVTNWGGQGLQVHQEAAIAAVEAGAVALLKSKMGCA